MLDYAASRYDAWVTREPDYGPEFPIPPKCETCGRFMRDEPLHKIYAEDTEVCTGVETVSFAYGDESWSLCGNLADHEPHDVVMSSYVVLYRRCSAGHISKEFVV